MYEIKEDYMLRAIELAKKGMGFTNPNPMVGAVIVKDDRIIGEGYHERCGQLHAERNAIASLTESAEGATIYVTLEPCCHYGKTPPCTEAILENKIARVVIGSRDPNPLVAGKGAAFLRENGVEVIEDFCRKQCDAINDIFFYHITKKKPYVTCKYAMTIDGKIATHTGDSKWITGEAARADVHKKRAHYAVIMAGIGTVLADDPLLNARIPEAHQPVRVIVDTNLRIPMDSQIVKTAREYSTIIACSEQAANSDVAKLLIEKGVEILGLPLKDNHVDLKLLSDKLYEMGYDSILIEGGGTLHEAAFASGIVNHIAAYIGPKIFGGAASKTPVEGEGIDRVCDSNIYRVKKISQFDDDLLIEYEL